MRLLCAISHHGLGHLAQTAPILHALQAARPGLEWLIWSGLPREHLCQRLRIPFTHREEAADIGMEMHDAVRVDVAASHRTYLAFHAQWAAHVATEAHWLRHEGVAAVLSNVAYLPLAAAGAAGLPGVAFCSLNWHDIAAPYLGELPHMPQVLGEMREAYAEARAFLRLQPALPMQVFGNAEDIPPLAALGRARHTELHARLGLTGATRVVLIGLGGIGYAPAGRLPRLEDAVWLVPDAWTARGRSDLIGYGATGMGFPDLMASADALVTKVGYGSFVEAAGLGLPVLYIDRPEWPETPWLTAWLRQHARAAAIREEELFGDRVGGMLEGLWRAPAPPRPPIDGASVAARRILELLGG